MLASIRQLDPASRTALRWMAIRLGMLLLIWSFPWLMGIEPLERIVILLSSVFAFSALFAMLVASVRRERIGAINLNTWDESVAFSGLAVLFHALHRIVY